MLHSTDTAFEVKLPDSVLAGVRAKSEQLHLAGKRLVSDAEWSKLQHEVRCFNAVTAFALFSHYMYIDNCNRTPIVSLSCVYSSWSVV